MAQTVKYYENNITYREGPFVLVSIGSGWRVEVERLGRNHPVVPDASVYDLCARLGLPLGKFYGKEDAEKVCDKLNEKVKERRIVLLDGVWKARERQRVT